MVIELLTRQPTIRLANTSTMKATYSQPCQVETQVKSDTQIWFGRSARLHTNAAMRHGTALEPAARAADAKCPLSETSAKPLMRSLPLPVRVRPFSKV